jgi:hypothetical protein
MRVLDAPPRLNKVIIGYAPSGPTSVYGGPVVSTRYRSTGQATFLAHAGGNAVPAGFQVSPDGRTLGYINNEGVGVCGHQGSVFLVDLATGRSTRPAPPAGSNLWYANALWFDHANTAYALFAKGPARTGVCSDQPTPVTPLVYKDVGSTWTETPGTAKRASESVDGWLATQAGTVSSGNNGIVGDDITSAPGPLTITKNGRTIALAPNVITFAWAPPSN